MLQFILSACTMKKFISLIIAMLALCTMLVGCGDKGLEQASTVYSGNAVFELTDDNKENFSVEIASKGTGKVERLIIGSKNYTDNYSYA